MHAGCRAARSVFPFCACGQRIVSGAEALPGAFDAAVARQQVVAVNAVAVAMQARNLRRVTDRALALIEARLAALMPANPPGRPPQLAGKPDGQLAGFDAGQPDRAPSAARPAETSGGSSQPVGKPDGQLAGFDAGAPDRAPSAARPAETSGGSSQSAGKPDGQLAGSDVGQPDCVPLPSARTLRDIRAAHPDPADKQALRERMDRLETRVCWSRPSGWAVRLAAVRYAEQVGGRSAA